jgi:para-aminobenzoate synthetase/4-amino-4-deoxychorismate lyase
VPGAAPLLFAAPRAVHAAWTVDSVRPLLDAVDRAVRDEGRWAVGVVSYEAAPAFDAALQVRSPAPGDGPALPLAWFAVFDGPRAFGPAALAACTAAPGDAQAHWTPEVDETAYVREVAATRAGIARGDYYQVNHTLRLTADAPVDALALWARLRAAQLDAGAPGGPVGYGAFLDTGAWRVASASPELFFARSGRELVARPMKGTAPRGRWSEEDDARAGALRASEKERAENVMIVDLLRNDLARVAEPGSVRVPALFALERYPTVWQLTSTVAATARPGTTLADLFAALFPCGSVTGAPKVAAMRRIASVERSVRGPYCGAVGVVAPGGDCVFNVAIRTAWQTADPRGAGGVTTRYGVGGGVTWDSDPAAEWQEALLKARVLAAGAPPAFALLETLRLDDGVYGRGEAHLARLAASARWFGRGDPTAAARAALAHVAEGHAAGSWRVRLTVAADGTADATATPAPAVAVSAAASAATVPWRVVLARAPVDADDPFLHHKTTHRAVYDARRAEAPWADDVLLVNGRGELTEFTVGNLVVRRDGACWTPPRASGLLGGVLRAELVAGGAVQERVLRPAELDDAEGVWLVNALRGWVPVRLAAGP